MAFHFRCDKLFLFCREFVLFCCEFTLCCREFVLFCHEFAFCCCEFLLFYHGFVLSCREFILFCQGFLVSCCKFLLCCCKFCCCRDTYGPQPVLIWSIIWNTGNQNVPASWSLTIIGCATSYQPSIFQVISLRSSECRIIFKDAKLDHCV